MTASVQPQAAVDFTEIRNIIAALPAMGCDSSEEMKRYGRGDYNATDEETRSECVDESSHTIENDIASRIRKLVRKRAFR